MNPLPCYRLRIYGPLLIGTVHDTLFVGFPRTDLLPSSRVRTCMLLVGTFTAHIQVTRRPLRQRQILKKAMEKGKKPGKPPFQAAQVPRPALPFLEEDAPDGKGAMDLDEVEDAVWKGAHADPMDVDAEPPAAPGKGPGLARPAFGPFAPGEAQPLAPVFNLGPPAGPPSRPR